MHAVNRGKQDMKEEMGSAKPGEMITFGTYPQTTDGADRTPIQRRRKGIDKDNSLHGQRRRQLL